MKAVNLIPADSRPAHGARSLQLALPTYVLLGVLAAGLVMMVLFVTASNDVSSRKAELATDQAELSQQQGEAARLKRYVDFATLTATRLGTVRGIADARFDWHSALSELASVVPANTSLQSLDGTIVPSASTGSGGAGAGAGSQLRGDLPGPAFELIGCSANQDDVARLMSRLRVMQGVVRVTLNSSQKSTSTAGAQSTSSGTSGADNGDCRPNTTKFDGLVFFTPVTGAGPTGVQTIGSASASGASSSKPGGGA